MLDIIGSTALAMGGNLVGGLINKRSADKAQAANQAQNARNEQMQKEFAQQGIRWKVADAKAAGIHPLAALGAQTTSYQPASIGEQPDYSMGNAVSNMGQDISRAVMAKATQPERELQMLQIGNAKLDLEGKAIDNQIRAAQLRKVNSPTMPPPLPTATSASGSQQTTAIPDVGWAQLDNGAIIAVPSSDMKNRIEDNIFHEAAHFWRNNLFPSSTPAREIRTQKGTIKLQPGQQWRKSWSRGGWIPYTPK